jgi:hypothetical protein
VVQVHDLHIRLMSTTEVALTCHMVVPGNAPGDLFLLEVCRSLKKEFGIGHASCGSSRTLVWIVPSRPTTLFDILSTASAAAGGQTGHVMTLVNDNIAAGFGRRLDRLPFVLLLVVGLLFSMIHCASCDLAFAKTDGASWAGNLNDQGKAPNTPEQQLPCHSGHCLSHVTAQHLETVPTPADLVPCAPSFGQEQFPAALAGLPLFKPPRA